MAASSREDVLLAIVQRTATMGGCSQTHHEHLSAEARRVLMGRPLINTPDEERIRLLGVTHGVIVRGQVLIPIDAVKELLR